MGEEGFEPSSLSAHAPKACASAVAPLPHIPFTRHIPDSLEALRRMIGDRKRPNGGGAAVSQQAPSIKTEGDLARNLTTFRRAIAPPFKSQNTAGTYAESVRQFIEFLAEKGMPRHVAVVRREHVEAQRFRN